MNIADIRVWIYCYSLVSRLAQRFDSDFGAFLHTFCGTVKFLLLAKEPKSMNRGRRAFELFPK